MRYEGTVAFQDGIFLFCFEYGTIPLTYDEKTDTILLQVDPDLYDSVLITDYVYSRTAETIIPPINVPFLDSKASDGIIGTWDLVYIEGKSNSAVSSANWWNEILSQDIFFFRYLFKQSGSGFSYSRIGGAENCTFFTYAANEGALRFISASDYFPFLAGNVSYSVQGDTLRITDGDLTLVLERYGSAHPI